MLKNYLTVAFRSFIKSKSFSLINIAGLSIGISTCILISLFVLDEVSFDRFHEKADRIYRVTELLHLPTEERHQVVTSPPMAPALERSFPEVLKSTRLNFSTRTIAYKDNKYEDTKILYADSAFLQMFTFPIVAGNPDKALIEPYSVVLTERAAKKYFGDEDPINKIMALSDTLSLTVTAVIENVPTNSHLQFDAVMSRSTLTKMMNGEPEDNWYNNGYYSYILLPEGYDFHKLEAKVPAFLDKEMGSDRKTGIWYDLIFQPLTSIHLHSTAVFDIGPNGNIKYVYTFSAIAILVLLIACANYINLATAKSVNRAKELGMRKVVGARKNQLIAQLMGESFLVTLLAFIVAIAIVSAALPSFNILTGKHIDIGALGRPDVLAAIVTIFLMISVFAGGYPALLMSSVSPLKTMNDYGRRGNAGNLVRKGLVVFQFSMSIILISSTIVIFQQIDFMQSRNLGLHKDQVMQIEMPFSVRSRSQVVRDELAKIPGVSAASLSSFSYADPPGNVIVLPEGAAESEMSSEATFVVDADFIPTFGIKLLAGRNFIKGNVADDSSSFIINEQAVKRFGWGTPADAIGKKLNWGLGKKGQVIGVVQDFNFKSLHSSIRPLIMHIIPDWYWNVSLKIEATDIPAVVKAVEVHWKELDPDFKFSYTFMDQDFQKLYKAEDQTRTIVGLLAILAIFIACLGLFGLAAFIAEQRTKEIGIRKVLGATAAGIITLMSKDFLKLLIIAFVIAVPIAWYAGSEWLTGFAFHTDVAWWIFAIAGGASATIAILTVSFQSVKASLMNPVKALRTE